MISWQWKKERGRLASMQNAGSWMGVKRIFHVGKVGKVVSPLGQEPIGILNFKEPLHLAADMLYWKANWRNGPQRTRLRGGMILSRDTAGLNTSEGD
jgi:hypothetical protein